MEYTKNTIVIGIVNNIKENGVFLQIENDDQYFGFLPIQNMVKSVDDGKNIILKKWSKVEVAIDSIKDGGFIVFSEKPIEKLKKKIEKQQHHKEQTYLYTCYAEGLQAGSVCECEITSVKLSGITLSYEGFEKCFVEEDEIAWGKQDAQNQNYREGQFVDAVFLYANEGTLYFSLKILRENPYSDSIYKYDTNNLLHYIGIEHNKFAGKVSIDNKNKVAFLVDIISYNNKEDETLNGELLINPYTGTNLKAIFKKDVDIEQLENGSYYEVQLIVAPEEYRRKKNEPFIIGVDTFKKLQENPYKHIVNEVFMYSDNPHSNTTIARLLEEVGKQLYSSKDRTFFELLQNADDAAAPKSNNSVEVIVDKVDDYLFFSHNGCSFNRMDFISISSAANSTKRKTGNKTGYKGIGFKSVFSDAESVHLLSGGFSVKFDKNNALLQNFHDFYYKARDCKNEEEYKQFLSRFSDDEKNFKGVSDMPWQILPIWDNFPITLMAGRHNVNIAIKTQAVDLYKDSISTLAKQPEFLLFLRNTKRLSLFGFVLEKSVTLGNIVLRSESNTQRYSKKDYDNIEISNEEFSKHQGLNLEIREITNATTGEVEHHFFENGQDKSSTIPNKLAEAKKTIISFVTKTEDGQIIPKETNSSTSPIFAYLPTSDKRFPFPFFVNADFVLSSNRESISGDNPWNMYLFAMIGQKLVDWVAELATQGHENYLNLLLPSLLNTESSDSKGLAKHFNSSYLQALNNTAIVVNNEGSLVKVNDIIIDHSGLSDVIGANDFLYIIGSDKTLPSPDINWEILENDVFNVTCIGTSDGPMSIYSYLKDNDRLLFWLNENRNTDKESAFLEWIDKKIQRERATNSRDLWSSFAKKLPIFSFSGVWLSFDDTNSSNKVILNKELSPLIPVLRKLEFDIADQLVEDCPLSIAYVNYERLLSLICSTLENSQLDPNEKRLIFFTDYHDNQAKNKINTTGLFVNENGEKRPLYSMFYNPIIKHDYLANYRLSLNEYSNELNDYIIRTERDIFSKIIIPNISSFLSTISFNQLYQDWKDYWSDDDTKYVLPMIHDENIKIQLMFNSGQPQQMINYLNTVNELNLDSNVQYHSNSNESKLLQIAVKAGTLQSFLSKVYVDGHRVIDYLVNDSLELSIDGRSYRFSLFDILPEKRSNILETIKRIVPEITFSNIQCKSLSPIEVKPDLQKYLEKTRKVTLPQFTYISLLQKYQYIQYNRTLILGYDIKTLLSFNKDWDLFDCIKYSYEHLGKFCGPMLKLGLDALGINSLKGLFIENSNLILPIEFIGTKFSHILNWANDSEKKEFLFYLGVMKSSDNDLIKWREAYYKRLDSATSVKLSEIHIPNTFKWIESYCEGFPVREDNEPSRSKALLAINKHKKTLCYSDNEQIKEYDLPQYQEWKKNGGNGCFILVKGQIIWRAMFNDLHMVSFRENNYCRCSDNNTILINGTDKESSIQSILLDIARDSSINQFSLSDYNSLFFVSSQELNEIKGKFEKTSAELKSVKEDLERLEQFGSIEEIIKKLSMQNNVNIDTTNSCQDNTIDDTSEEHDCENVRIFLGGGYDISDDRIMSEHMLSKYRILQYIKAKYTLHNSFDEKEYVTNGKEYQRIRLNGDRYVYPQGAKYGIWYLSSNIWSAIVEEGDIACVCIGDKEDDFRIFETKEQIDSCIDEKPNALIKISSNEYHSVSESVNSIFPSDNYDENTHLMLMLKPTPKAEINSLYNDVYKSNQDNTADF